METIQTHYVGVIAAYIWGAFKRAARPLGSRKVRVALATVIAAIAADSGLEVGEEVVLGILGLGASLILGIAHEDAGRFRALVAASGRTGVAERGERRDLAEVDVVERQAERRSIGVEMANEREVSSVEKI